MNEANIHAPISWKNSRVVTLTQVGSPVAVTSEMRTFLPLTLKLVEGDIHQEKLDSR